MRKLAQNFIWTLSLQTNHVSQQQATITDKTVFLYVLICCVVAIVFPSDILFPYVLCDKVFRAWYYQNLIPKSRMIGVDYPFKDEAQTALFKEPVHTTQ